MAEDTNPTVKEPAVALMRGLLEGSVRYMGRGPQGPPPADPRAANAMAAHYAGAAARLLHALKESADPAVTRAVASQLDEWLSSGEPLADWVGEKAAECGIDVDALIEQRLRPNPAVTEQASVQAELEEQGDAPTEPAPELARSSVILGRALLDRDGYVWPHDRNQATGHGEGVWLSKGEVEQRYGPAREVLLVSPAAGRVLEAARTVVVDHDRYDAAFRDAFEDLVHAVHDAMVGDRPTSPSLPPVAQLPAYVEGKSCAFWTNGDEEQHRRDCPIHRAEPVPVPDSTVTPGHPAKAGAGYDCSCGECQALRAVPVPDSDGKGWDRDLVDAFSESSGEVARLERELSEVTEERNRLRLELAGARAELEWVADHTGPHPAPPEPVPVPDSGRPTVSRCLNCNGDLVAWKIATALGDVPEGAEAIQGNPEEQAERLIAEGDRLRGELEQSQAHAARWETTAWEWSQKTDAMREELEQLRVNVAGLLMTARRDGAAAALEEAANDAHRALSMTGERAFSAADLRQRAAEVRSGQRRIEPTGSEEASDATS